MPPKLFDLNPYSVPNKDGQWKILWRDTHHHVYIINIYTHYIVNIKESQCKKMGIHAHVENRLLMQYVREHCDFSPHVLDFHILENVAENMLVLIREKEEIYQGEEDALFYEVEMPLKRLRSDLDSLRDDFFANDIREFNTELRSFSKAEDVVEDNIDVVVDIVDNIENSRNMEIVEDVVDIVDNIENSRNIEIVDNIENSKNIDIVEDIDNLIEDLYENSSKKKKVPLVHRKKIKNLPPIDYFSEPKEYCLEKKEEFISEEPISPIEPILEPISESIKEPILEPIPEPISEPIPEPISEPILEPISEPIKSIKEPIIEEDYVEKYRPIYTNYSNYSLKELSQYALDISRENLEKVGTLICAQKLNKIRMEELNYRINKMKTDMEDFRTDLEQHTERIRNLSNSFNHFQVKS